MQAPILGDLPRLPTPLGTLLYTSPYFTNLSVEDRLSALPLALDLLRYDVSEAEYARYDDMSARDMFLNGGGSIGGGGGGGGSGGGATTSTRSDDVVGFPFNGLLPTGGGGGGGSGSGGSGGSGASPALYERFLAPILCALMFAPPEELSAAAAMDVLYGGVATHAVDPPL